MSFLNKGDYSEKPSLIKPILIVVGLLLVVGGAYSLGSNSNKIIEAPGAAAGSASKADSNVAASGLDKNMKIQSVADVEMIISKWVETNPKVIIDAVINMQKKEAADKMKNAQANIGNKKQELYEDKNSPTIAPAGYDVTIVEFFDYSCGYCKKAQATVEALLKEDKKVRFVFKEYPILGQGSVDLSTIALAVNIMDKNSYHKFHAALMKSNARDKASAMKIARKVGINISKLKRTLESEKAKIAQIIKANHELGASVGVTGTPAFIIGDKLSPGAADIAALKAQIKALRGN